MREEEKLIGDYTRSSSITNKTRASMILLIERLSENKEYTIDTICLAISLLDRYLAISEKVRRVSCLGTIAVSCLLIAAKVEEAIIPSYKNMCNLLAKLQLVTIKPSQICACEKQILIALDFSVRHVASINFLERYLRLYGMDKGKETSP